MTFQARYPGQRQGAVLLRATDGSLLGSELLNATGVGSTGVFVPGLISTAAGDGQWIYRGDGGLATQSPLFLPMGGAADAAGNLFLSDSNNQRVFVPRQALKSIQVLGVVGSPLRAKRRKTPPADQPTLF